MKNITVVFAGLFILTLAGCGGGTPENPEEQLPSGKDKMRDLYRVFSQYNSMTQGRNPSKEGMKSWLQQMVKQEHASIKDLKIKDVNKFFISPRDNKEVQFRFVRTKTPLRKEDQTKQPILFYETEGKNGMHYIVRQGGNIEEISSEDLKKELAGR